MLKYWYYFHSYCSWPTLSYLKLLLRSLCFWLPTASIPHHSYPLPPFPPTVPHLRTWPRGKCIHGAHRAGDTSGVAFRRGRCQFHLLVSGVGRLDPRLVHRQTTADHGAATRRGESGIVILYHECGNKLKTFIVANSSLNCGLICACVRERIDDTCYKLLLIF